MKTIGILGGMSSESTTTYYNFINREVNKRLGGNFGAKIIVYSFNFEDIVALQKANRWDLAGAELARGAKVLEDAGSDIILIATNTMHKVAEDIEHAITIPLINIIDYVAQSIKEKGLNKILLLGTKFTMVDTFYRQRLENHGIEVLIPNEQEMDQVHSIIFDELCVNIITDQSRNFYLDVIKRFHQQHGAQGVIFGCTEIGLLLDQKIVGNDVVVFDSTEIHSLAAVDLALESK